MYKAAETYTAAIRAPVRREHIGGRLTLRGGGVVEITDSVVVAGSVSVDNQCVSGQELAFGGVYMGQAKLQLRTGRESRDFYDAALELTYQLELEDGSVCTVPVGVYTVASAERSAASVSLTAYDNMLKLETPFAGSVLQGDAYTMLAQLAEHCGVALGQSEEDIKSLSENAALIRQLDGSYNVSTWRDCAGAIAQLLAGFATMDRLGRLVIRQFAAEPCVTLDKDARNSVKISDFSCHYAALCIETAAGALDAGAEGDEGLTMTITDMPLAENGMPEVRQGVCNALFSTLQRLDYTPAEVTLPGDPALELGDRVALPTPQGTAETLVTHLVWKFRGAMTLKGVGKNPYLAGSSGQNDRQLRTLQRQAEANKVIYYSFTNPEEVVVDGDSEKIAASLTFVTTQATSAMFLAQILLEARPKTETLTLPVTGDSDAAGQSVTLTRDADLTLTVRYYLDEVLVDSFAPAQRLQRGKNVLALFYPFPDLESTTNHRWSVRLVCAGGTVTVGRHQLKATITGQGMAGGDVWNGDLSPEELLALIERGSFMRSIGKMGDTVALAQQAPQPCGLTETLGAIPKTAGRTVSGLAETLAQKIAVRSTTYAYGAQHFGCDARLVQADVNGWQLRTSWQTNGVPLQIDEGALLCAAVNTAGLAQVTKIEVNP